MPERPEEIATLELLLEAIRVAHEAVYDLHRRLAAGEAAGRSQELVKESARIVLELAPQLAGDAWRLFTRWSEESALDPERAESTAELLAAEVRSIDPELRALLARQTEIARELRRELE
jgi:hypothetical protein